MRAVWLIFLLMIGMIGFLYIPFDYAQEQVVPELAASLQNTQNATAMGWLQYIWWYLPVIFLMIFVFWAWTQGQKEG